MANFQVYSDQGRLQVDGNSYNYVLHNSGTVILPSNTPDVGTIGTITGLPSTGVRHLVAIRTAGYACVTATTPTGFTYHMAQGTTYMEWYAFARPTVAISAGLEVYKPDGSIAFNIGRPPVDIREIYDVPMLDGASSGDLYTANVLPSRVLGIADPAHAFLFSDPGVIADHYRGFPFSGSPGWNERYKVGMRIVGSTIEIAGVRYRPNRGSLQNGMTYQTQAVVPPAQLIGVKVPPP